MWFLFGMFCGFYLSFGVWLVSEIRKDAEMTPKETLQVVFAWPLSWFLGSIKKPPRI